MSDRLSRLLGAVVFTAATAVMFVYFGFAALVVLRHGWIYLAVSIVLSIAVAVVVHEVGHLAAALMLGFRIFEFAAGPVAVDGEGTSARLRWRWLPWPVLGRVKIQRQVDRQTRWRTLLIVVAGPLTNVLFATACLTLLYSCDVPDLREVVYFDAIPFKFASWLNLLGIGSLLVGIAGVYPDEVWGHLTDGAQVLKCLTNPAVFDRAVAISELNAPGMGGKRPSEWDTRLVEAMVAGHDGSVVDATVLLLGYYHFLDRGEFERADQVLRSALERRTLLPAASRARLLAEGAYFEAFHHGDLVQARRWWRQMQATWQVDAPARLRAEAAILAREGRHSQAAAKAEEGIASVCPEDPSGAAVEIGCLTRILAECRRALGEQSPPADAMPG